MSERDLPVIVLPRGGSRNFWLGGVQTLVQKVLLNVFVSNYFSQRTPHVSQSVNAGRRWRGRDCFASRGEQFIGGYSKTITFWISLEFSLEAKCNRRFIKKISQLKSDLRSCRCKNFSNKLMSDRGVRTHDSPGMPWTAAEIVRIDILYNFVTVNLNLHFWPLTVKNNLSWLQTVNF